MKRLKMTAFQWEKEFEKKDFCLTPKKKYINKTKKISFREFLTDYYKI